MSTSSVAAAPVGNPREVGTSGFRSDIQGLRALAVLLVVAFHLFPWRLPGGYVGVDVFFVISGYLITRHLLDEIEATGRLSLLRFWARRARRLLPASLLVLVVSLVLAWRFLPQTQWLDTARQGMGSALYVQNWVLAADAVDYSAANVAATVFQHYWSLSVEEQFYACWPLVLIALLAIRNRLGGVTARERGSARTLVAAGLAVVFLMSLAWSVLATRADQAHAYFATPTRLWEFAAGGLLSVLWNRPLRPGLQGLVAWAGIGGILAAAFLLSGESAFPGWIALLPVVGAVLVLADPPAGNGWGPRWLSSRPMVFVGDISYAVYLWHWPLIVIAPRVLDRSMDLPMAAGIAGMTFVLSVLSTRLVEDPLRRGLFLRSAGRTFGFAALAMAVAVTASFGLRTLLDRTESATLPAGPSPCVGPGALKPAHHCDPIAGDGPPVPGPIAVSEQGRKVAYPGCQATADATEVVTCELGADPVRARHHLAIVGDSHATMWFPALDLIGERHDVAVHTYTRSSCPMTWAIRHDKNEQVASYQPKCLAWVDEVNDRLLADPELDTVFTAAYSTAYTFTPRPGRSSERPGVDGFLEMWRGWRSAGMNVVVLSDVPRTRGSFVPTCLVENDDPLDCATTRAQALPGGAALPSAAREAAAAGIAVDVDLTDKFCDSQRCHAVVGRRIVYRDYSHLAIDYARALVPAIERNLREAKLSPGLFGPSTRDSSRDGR